MISIHETHKGLDFTDKKQTWDGSTFQSTRPTKASTHTESGRTSRQCKFQSTRPTKASTKMLELYGYADSISIHETHKGLDRRLRMVTHGFAYFNPRDPQRPRRKNAGTVRVCGQHFNPRDPQRPRQQKYATNLLVTLNKLSTFHILYHLSIHMSCSNKPYYNISPLILVRVLP